MPSRYPQRVALLLEASDSPRETEAWEAFVDQYSRLLLSICRSPGRRYDDTMDRYAFVLERLKLNDYHRLRSYSNDGRTKFSSWLLVVAQRICVDYQRQRYGRAPPGTEAEEIADGARRVRRRLADLITSQIDVSDLRDSNAPNPESQVAEDEVRSALAAATRALSSQDRLLVALRYEDNAPWRDVCELVGYPTRFHAHRRLKQALEKMRRSLEAAGFRRSGL